VSEYVDFIREAKAAVSIPVIASVNCTYSHEWVSFAKDIEAAGADGLELNMFFLPSDMARSSDEREKDYLQIVDRVLKQVRIPVALKISSSFSTLAQMIGRLENRHCRPGPVQQVLFDRFRHREAGRHRLEQPEQPGGARGSSALGGSHVAPGGLRHSRFDRGA
jgi:dihydroorotate dehydrogenase (fumarate)